MRVVLVAWFLLLTPALAHDPTGVAVAPNGKIYVADPYRCRIFEVTPEGQVSLFAGSAAGKGSIDGPRLDACFGDPHGLACAPDGVLYVTDYATGRVRRIGLDGKVATIAGSGEGFRDGPGAQALFDGINGVAADGKGNVFVADSRNHRIRRIDAAGFVSTLAGGEEGLLDGPGTEARFSLPIGIALAPDGSLFVADSGNRSVRKIGSDGRVTTHVGRGLREIPTDGRPSVSPFLQLGEPWGIAVAPEGDIYVTDGGTGRVIRIENRFVLVPLRLVPRGGTPASGPAPERRRTPLDRPCAIAADRRESLYVLDHFTGPALVLSRISPDCELTTLVNFEGQPGAR